MFHVLFGICLQKNGESSESARTVASSDVLVQADQQSPGKIQTTFEGSKPTPPLDSSDKAPSKTQTEAVPSKTQPEAQPETIRYLPANGNRLAHHLHVEGDKPLALCRSSLI